MQDATKISSRSFDPQIVLKSIVWSTEATRYFARTEISTSSIHAQSMLDMLCCQSSETSVMYKILTHLRHPFRVPVLPVFVR